MVDVVLINPLDIHSKFALLSVS